MGLTKLRATQLGDGSDASTMSGPEEQMGQVPATSLSGIVREKIPALGQSDSAMGGSSVSSACSGKG